MTISRSFRQFTILLCLASALAVQLPQAAGAQATIVMDLGDAPDGTNALSATMHAYPGVLARFPTSLLPDDQPPGPRHINAGLLYHLGNSISNEAQAEQGADADGVNNIIPNGGIVDNENGDDGLILPGSLQHCKRTQLRYRVRVTNLVSAPLKVYVNLWADWNRDGSWTPPRGLVCPGASGTVAEWAVSNRPIILPGPGSYMLTTPTFLVWNDKPTSNMWLRFGLSDTPAPDPDGRGPKGGYARGETEDYRLEGAPQPVLIPAIQRVTPIALVGKRAALALSTVYLPLAQSFVCPDGQPAGN